MKMEEAGANFAVLPLLTEKKTCRMAGLFCYLMFLADCYFICFQPVIDLS